MRRCALILALLLCCEGARDSQKELLNLVAEEREEDASRLQNVANS